MGLGAAPTAADRGPVQQAFYYARQDMSAS